MQSTLIMYLIVSVVLIVLSVPLMAGWLKPNFFYGYRMPLTLSKPELWFAVNAYAGRLLVVAAVVNGLAALGLYQFAALDAKSYAIDCAAVLLICLFITVGLSWRYMMSRIE